MKYLPGSVIVLFVLGDKDAVKIVWAVGVELSKDAGMSNVGSDMKLTWKLPEIWNMKQDQLFHCAFREFV